MVTATAGDAATHSLIRSINFLASVTCIFCRMRASLLPGLSSFLLALSIDFKMLRTSCAVAFVSSILPSNSCNKKELW